MEDVDYETVPNSPLAINLMAGALAGITEHSIMYPMDSIKTRMQVLHPSPSAVYSGISQAISRISTTEGVYALWRGVNSVIVGAGPAHALYFATYEKCKDAFGAGGDGKRQIMASAAAGACATIAADALMNPFEVVKTRLQLPNSNLKYRGAVHCALDVFRREGLAAFYVSYPTTLTMTIPFQSVQFASYEYFRNALNPIASLEYDATTHIIAGGAAGAIAAAATNPLDVAKTLLNTRGTSSDPEIRNCNGLFRALRLIHARHGLLGFSKGVRPRIITHVPATAICWATYEYFKWGLGKGGFGSTTNSLGLVETEA